jgi:isopenicillin-N epimerase
MDSQQTLQGSTGAAPGSISRREFVTYAAIGATALATQSCGAEENDPAITPGSFATEWKAVRDQFDIKPGIVDLSALLIASHPRPVKEAIERHRHGLDEDPVTYLTEQITRNERRVVQRAAEYLSATAGDIALTDSTTMGLGLVYNGVSVGPGQEILTTEQNYYSTDEALRLKAEKSGATVRRVPLYAGLDAVSIDELVGSVINAIGPATRVAALTWVHSSTGLKLPIAAIADGISEINQSRAEEETVLLGIDGVHGFGVEDFEVSDLGCDYFAAGCHKWMFGPRGTGIIWASDRGWENVSPTIPTFMDDSVRDAWITGNDVSGTTNGRRISPGGFKAFEHQWAMAEAFDFHLEIGKRKIAERTHALARYLKEGLSEMSHIRLYTPMSSELSSGIVCFDIEGMSPRSVVERLRGRNVIATVTPYADSHARLTPSIRNSEGDIETALRVIREIA